MSTPIHLPDQPGGLLRSARFQRGLTQADIAKQLGVTVQTASKLENNAGRAGFHRVHSLYLVLGLELVLQPLARRDAAPSASEW